MTQITHTETGHTVSVSIPNTVRVVPTFDRLVALGFDEETATGVATYVLALNRAQAQKAVDQYRHLLQDDSNELREYFGIDPGAKKGQKYVRVVHFSPSWRTGEIVPSSVHAVLVVATGELCKAAGWKGGPARSTAAATKGQLLSNFNLSVPEDVAKVVTLLRENPSAAYGGYLYQR